MTRRTPTQIALDAMQTAEAAMALIEKHEIECSNRWRETTLAVNSLRQHLGLHAKRWEKLAWILTSSLVAAAAATIISNVI